MMRGMSDIPLNPISKIDREPNGQLRPGSVLNPNGRPVGSYSGFRRVMETINAMMNDPKVQAKLQEALRKEAEEHPFRFARQFILPGIRYKDRKAFRERIRAAEQAAFDKAAAPFSGVSKTDAP
jgi:hypothetical protein